MKRFRLRGWRIGKVRGVDLKIHFSLVFLLLYVVLVASGQFPHVLQRSGVDAAAVGGGPLVWGIVFAFGLFLSVLIHEFAHVVMAQSMGVKVEGITLMMLGGVSEMEKIPEKPYAEFKVSIVGPLTSFAIAGVLFALRASADAPNVEFFCYWLARVNLILGIFNLLPAFPMDGGRALRSVLAARQGMASATQTAVKVGKGFAWVLGILGFLSFNFLLMLIAIFIYSAANAELVIAVSRGMLTGIKAGEAGIRTVLAREDQTLMEVAEQMLQNRHRVLPVWTSSGTPALVSIENLKQVPRESWRRTLVRDTMEKAARYLDAKEPLDEALPELAASGVLPLRENGNIVGVVRYIDIAELLDLKSLSEQERGARRRAA